jgi:hypothetical protein
LPHSAGGARARRHAASDGFAASPSNSGRIHAQAAFTDPPLHGVGGSFPATAKDRRAARARRSAPRSPGRQGPARPPARILKEWCQAGRGAEPSRVVIPGRYSRRSPDSRWRREIERQKRSLVAAASFRPWGSVGTREGRVDASEDGTKVVNIEAAVEPAMVDHVVDLLVRPPFSKRLHVGSWSILLNRSMRVNQRVRKILGCTVCRATHLSYGPQIIGSYLSIAIGIPRVEYLCKKIKALLPMSACMPYRPKPLADCHHLSVWVLSMTN